MAIRFACAQCGMIHRVPDHFAGKRGRCGRCGYRFVAPGTTPSTASVFVPADDSDLPDDQDDQLTDRPTRDWSGVWSTTIVGLLVGLLLIACAFLLRDSIVSNAPGLAPLLPPQAGPNPRFPAQQPNPLLVFDKDKAMSVVLVLVNLIHLLVLVVIPLAIPSILSRGRVLSVGRWLIMSAVSGFFAFTSAFLLTAVTSFMTQAQDMKGMPMAVILCFVATYTLVFSFFGIPGCLIGAAVHPKDDPRP